MAIVTVCAIGVSVLACAMDLYARRIPNLLTATAVAAALVFHGLSGGLAGSASSILGTAVGLALFFPLFALRGLGAGDVKLLGALGAWVGPSAIAWTALYGALAGGIMAVVVALVGGYLRTALENVWTLLGFWRFAGIRPLDGMTLATSKGPRLPYALPITTGLVLALWLH